jgi:hypothetical protein
MAKELEEIKRHIDTGDLEAARHSLSLLTSTDPLNSIAWELLASITDDPIERVKVLLSRRDPSKETIHFCIAKGVAVPQKYILLDLSRIEAQFAPIVVQKSIFPILITASKKCEYRTDYQQ